MKNGKATVICVVYGGVLSSVYSDDPDIQVELLDYDDMDMTDIDSEEYQDYKRLESLTESDSFKAVW